MTPANSITTGGDMQGYASCASIAALSADVTHEVHGVLCPAAANRTQLSQTSWTVYLSYCTLHCIVFLGMQWGYKHHTHMIVCVKGDLSHSMSTYSCTRRCAAKQRFAWCWGITATWYLSLKLVLTKVARVSESVTGCSAVATV